MAFSLSSTSSSSLFSSASFSSFLPFVDSTPHDGLIGAQVSLICINRSAVEGKERRGREGGGGVHQRALADSRRKFPTGQLIASTGPSNK